MQRRRIRALMLTFCMVLAAGSPSVMAFGALPDTLSLTAGSQTYLELALPVSAQLEQGDTSAQLDRNAEGIAIEAGDSSGSGSLIFRLLGIVPVKRVALEVEEERMLIPGGQPVGIAIETQGLVVVGMSDLGSTPSPARVAGLKSGDVITAVNGEAVREPGDLAALMQANVPAEITLVRENEECTLQLTPKVDVRDGVLRIGAWVRSSTAGVGTLTYVDPETGNFGALGHAISDIDTGIVMPVADGGLYESGIAQIQRGTRGAPGEIVGDFLLDPNQIGEITQNTNYGIFGENYAGELNEALPIAARSEVQIGQCEILSAVDGTLRSYDCEIERIDRNSSTGMRALVLHVTDEDLIAKTGGIVQGMSGSPIIQDGKFVGAVTHVLVNDPTRGYGIFIESMLEAAG